MVLGMEVDMGFTIGTPIPELSSEKFMDDEVVLLLPANHPLYKKKEIQLQDLDKETFVIREPNSLTRRAFDKLFSTVETQPAISMELDSLQSIKWAVVEGYGISLMPKHAATSMGQSVPLGIKRIREISFPMSGKRNLESSTETIPCRAGILSTSP